MTPPRLKIAPRVTRAHGEAFADGWLKTVLDSGSMFKVYEDTGVIKWPPGDEFNPRQARYESIEDEILARVFANVRGAVANEFVLVAREVLARERRRQR